MSSVEFVVALLSSRRLRAPPRLELGSVGADARCPFCGLRRTFLNADGGCGRVPPGTVTSGLVVRASVVVAGLMFDEMPKRF
ncbi:MYB31 transcription factor31 [Zea mays]|uniref:MYB31 transcription factor31 n=1 Tax=Zea mays TaxID=4577 RepID=A0A1D6EU06_MAIZE|nr:MYB31 transcription factor31 [Zea mays]